MKLLGNLETHNLECTNFYLLRHHIRLCYDVPCKLSSLQNVMFYRSQGLVTTPEGPSRTNYGRGLESTISSPTIPIESVSIRPRSASEKVEPTSKGHFICLLVIVTVSVNEKVFEYSIQSSGD